MKEDFVLAAEFCEKMQQAVGAAVARVKQELLAGVRAAKSPQALTGALRDLTARDGDLITWNMKVDGKQVYTMEAVAGYIYAEMLTNYNSAEASEILTLNNTSNKFFIGPSQLSLKIKSYLLWSYKVAPHKDISNNLIIGEWDHKTLIRNNYGRFSYDSTTKMVYMYDIWSNIHYGFVGAAAAFTASELTTGAGVANVLSSLGTSLGKYGQMDDPRDQAAIQLGIDLWSKYGESLDIDTLVAAVRDQAVALSTFECDCLAR